MSEAPYQQRISSYHRQAYALLSDPRYLGLPSNEELREELQFISPSSDMASFEAALKAEAAYLQSLQRLIAARAEADQQWAGTDVSADELSHRQGDLAGIDDLMPIVDGQLTDAFLRRASKDCTAAAILYSLRSLISSLPMLSSDLQQWWAEQSNEYRLEQALELVEQVSEAEPEQCRGMLSSEQAGAALVRALRSGNARSLIEDLRDLQSR